MIKKTIIYPDKIEKITVFDKILSNDYFFSKSYFSLRRFKRFNDCIVSVYNNDIYMSKEEFIESRGDKYYIDDSNNFYCKPYILLTLKSSYEYIYFDNIKDINKFLKNKGLTSNGIVIKH